MMMKHIDHGDDLGGDFGENHEINVTPFIDVMLVLLIIFMVVAPLSTVDVPVDLPASNSNSQQRPDEPLFLTVQSDLTLSLGDKTVPREDLAFALNQAMNDKRDERIFLRADKAVTYGELMEIINLLRSAGYLKVALVGLEGAP